MELASQASNTADELAQTSTEIEELDLIETEEEEEEQRERGPLARIRNFRRETPAIRRFDCEGNDYLD